MAVKFKNSININDQYTLPSTVGLTNQYLKVNDAATGELVFADLSQPAQVSTIAYEVKNETGVSIPKGSVVYISGGSGASGHVTIALSSALSEATSSKTFGITAETIANNSTGDVVLEGLIEGLDTSAFTNGGTLWLGDTPGSIQAYPPPSTPSHAVFVGYAVRIQQNNGSMFVKIQNGYELEELHDVLVTSATDGQVLTWDAANSYWKNVDQLQPGQSVIYTDNFTGDDSTTIFTLSNDIDSENNTSVYFDGVYQSKSNYSLLTNQLTFAVAPPAAVDIEVVSIKNVTLAASVEGTGTANYVTKWTDDDTIGNSVIYDDGTNVGIGTNSPTQKLDVSGNARITGALYDSNNSAGTSGQILSSTATGTDWIDAPATSFGSIAKDDFVGNGTQVSFTLSVAPFSVLFTSVYVSGVYQEKETYSITDSTITFTAAPPSSSSIEVISLVVSNITPGANTITRNDFTGTGSQTDYTLTVAPSSINFVDVYVSGAYQNKNGFSVVGNTLSFSEAPASGNEIEVMIISDVSLVQNEQVNYGCNTISTNTAAVKNNLYVLTADLTLTLPASPANGDSIKISNLSGVATCILGRNGSLIMGVATDLTLDTPSASFELIYSGATKGWVIIGL